MHELPCKESAIRRMATKIRGGGFRLLRRALCDCAARDLFRRLNASIPTARGGPLARRVPREAETRNTDPVNASIAMLSQASRREKKR
jgi:hypothetical protein